MPRWEKGATKLRKASVMEADNQPGHEDVPAPGPNAELTLSISSVPPWGALKGLVPADQAHHLITTSGILGSAVTGTAGAVLTLRASGGGTALAYAELALALIAAALIAVCGRSGTRAKRGQAKDDHPRTVAQ
jgi:hypothetical protein